MKKKPIMAALYIAFINYINIVCVHFRIAPINVLVTHTVFKIFFILVSLQLFSSNDFVFCADEIDQIPSDSESNDSRISDDSAKSVSFDYRNIEEFRSATDSLNRLVPSVDTLTYALIKVSMYLVQFNPGIESIQLESIRNCPSEIFTSTGSTGNEENFDDMVDLLLSEIHSNSSRAKSLLRMHEMLFRGYEKIYLEPQDYTNFGNQPQLSVEALQTSFEKIKIADGEIDRYFLSPMKFFFSAEVNGQLTQLEFSELDLAKVALKSHYGEGIRVSSKLLKLFS